MKSKKANVKKAPPKKATPPVPPTAKKAAPPPAPTPALHKAKRASPKGGKRSAANEPKWDVKGTCRVIGCNSPATTGGYSRTCYIKYWKQIKQKEVILKEGTLDRFLRELVDKYPEKVLVAIYHDLQSEEAYAHMIRELDLYGGIDEMEHEVPVVDEESNDNAIDDIKKDIGGKEEDLF